MTIAEDLPRKLDALPDQPGVYLMKDARGQVIYVGKAKVLRHRVRSYFQRPEDKDAKTQLLVRRIADFDYIVVDSEKEALIAENTLIKKHRPHYNIQLRDDKNYLCVKVSVQDDFPRIYLVRSIRRDGARYFGPYSSAHALRETLSLLNRYFPLRKCSDAQFAGRDRPCLMYQIGRSLAPCVNYVTKEEYAKIVDQVILFLEGRDRELIEVLAAKMGALAEDLRYEDAARVRDQIAAIERTLEKQKAVSATPLDQDAIGLYREGGRVEVAILFFRQGKMLGSRDFGFSQMELSDEEIVASFVKQFYAGDRYVPDEVLVPADFEDREGVEDLLRELRGRATRISLPRRGDRVRLVEMARNNAEAYFRSRGAEGADAAATLEQVGRAFGLAGPPLVVDCFDISHLGGTLTVGSKVRFREGEPDKAGYRRFRLRTAGEGDDYAAMREVLGRWIEQARKEGEFPDLVLIDGGRGQLAMAERAFRELEYLQSGLASIAKPLEGEAADKFFLPGRKNPVVFKHGSSALFLLQRIRDEAHRFAVAYNRALRRKANLRSALDDVPGVGAKRRALLLRAFGSLKRLGAATREEIAATPGVPPRVAEAVYAFLHSADAASGADAPGES